MQKTRSENEIIVQAEKPVCRTRHVGTSMNVPESVQDIENKGNYLCCYWLWGWLQYSLTSPGVLCKLLYSTRVNV